eukprot:TRINITY_DN20537_c0_g1::TRINITY_DN20537_c0_g1_i1::g.12326::m.12326 TRINITY_DN20537_c0_g1::TRINITY_DN20537_c0_g1_i1::g.12326  ORF type:complete len:160 (+),score=13.32,sp/S0F332/PAP_GEOSE/27.56/4e-14,LMWPc/PF01451.16/2.8e-21 TRINITY_DN20537_c0_g1_i1:47-526(+)
MLTLLFVCTSNTCRTPMAEGIAKHWLATRLGTTIDQLELKGYKVRSGALTDAYEPANSPASENSVIAMKNRGIDISGHRSTLLTPHDLKQANHIICVTPHHAMGVISMDPEAQHKTHSFSTPIPDPWHMSLDAYESCADALMRLVPEILSRLLKIPSEQ